MTIKIETKFGTYEVDKTKVEYQVVVYGNEYDSEDIPKLKKYFDKLGKYEKILKGACFILDSLGISNCKKEPDLIDEDIDNIEFTESQGVPRIGYLDIYIRSRKLDKYEKIKYDNKYRLPLEPETIAEMIKNIEKYEMLKKSRTAFKELKKEGE